VIKASYLKPLPPNEGRAYFGLHKGERHPIEAGYNAGHYGISPFASVDAHVHSENIIDQG
jgi:hypothetical protein